MEGHHPPYLQHSFTGTKHILLNFVLACKILDNGRPTVGSGYPRVPRVGRCWAAKGWWAFQTAHFWDISRQAKHCGGRCRAVEDAALRMLRCDAPPMQASPRQLAGAMRHLITCCGPKSGFQERRCRFGMVASNGLVVELFKSRDGCQAKYHISWSKCHPDEWERYERSRGKACLQPDESDMDFSAPAPGHPPKKPKRRTGWTEPQLSHNLEIITVQHLRWTERATRWHAQAVGKTTRRSR